MGNRNRKHAADQREKTAPTMTVHVPLAIRKRGGRKVIVTPQGVPARPQPAVRIDSTLVRALARAHRWKRMLESGEFGSITELAAAEKVNQSYLCRMLRLNLLAPEIVERLLDGADRAPEVQDLVRPFPLRWDLQVRFWLCPAVPVNAA
jgi:hypothetical protein